jgi:hypothetical protein
MRTISSALGGWLGALRDGGAVLVADADIDAGCCGGEGGGLGGLGHGELLRWDGGQSMESAVRSGPEGSGAAAHGGWWSL